MMGFKWVLEHFSRMPAEITSPEFGLPTDSRIRFQLNISSRQIEEFMFEVRIGLRLKCNATGRPLPPLKCRLVLVNLDEHKPSPVKEVQLDSSRFKVGDELLELKICHNVYRSYLRTRRKEANSWGDTWELICEVSEIKRMNMKTILNNQNLPQ